MTATPTTIGTKQVVRLRQRRMPMGPFNLITFVLTPVKSSATIRKFLTEEQARQYATEQGWSVIG